MRPIMGQARVPQLDEEIVPTSPQFRVGSECMDAQGRARKRFKGVYKERGQMTSSLLPPIVTNTLHTRLASLFVRGGSLIPFEGRSRTLFPGSLEWVLAIDIHATGDQWMCTAGG